MVEKENSPAMSKEETIGYHKGAINTLLAERNELLKMASVTEKLIEAHALELQKLGVNLGSHTESKESIEKVPKKKA